MAIIRVVPGPQTNQDGTYPEWRGGRKGTAGVQDMGGRYEESSYRQVSFIAVCPGPQVLSTTTTTPTTYTGLYVGNPSGSGRNFSVLEITVAIASATTAPQAIALAYSPYVTPVQGTSAGPLPTTISSGVTSVAKVGSSATLSSGPQVCRALQGFTATTVVGTGFVKDDVGGAIIVPPGQAIMLVAVGAASSVVASITWEEINL